MLPIFKRYKSYSKVENIPCTIYAECLEYSAVLYGQKKKKKLNATLSFFVELATQQYIIIAISVTVWGNNYPELWLYTRFSNDGVTSDICLRACQIVRFPPVPPSHTNNQFNEPWIVNCRVFKCKMHFSNFPNDYYSTRYVLNKVETLKWINTVWWQSTTIVYR